MFENKVNAFLETCSSFESLKQMRHFLKQYKQEKETSCDIVLTDYVKLYKPRQKKF